MGYPKPVGTTMKDKRDIISKIDEVVDNNSNKKRFNKPVMDVGAGGYDSEFSALQDMTQGPVNMAAARANITAKETRAYLRLRRDGLARTKAAIKAGIRVAQGRDVEIALKGAGYEPLSDEDFSIDAPTPEKVAESIFHIKIKNGTHIKEMAAQLYQLGVLADEDEEAVAIGQQIKEDVDKACIEIMEGKQEIVEFDEPSAEAVVNIDEEHAKMFVEDMLEGISVNDSQDIASAMTSIIEGAFLEGIADGASLEFESIIEMQENQNDSTLVYGSDNFGNQIACGFVMRENNITMMLENIEMQSSLRVTGANLEGVAKAALVSLPALYNTDTNQVIDLDIDDSEDNS